MAKNLNKDTVYRAAKSKDKDYTINDGEGLVLLVKSSGSKLWRFIYRFNGKQIRLSFGSYPDTSLENARRQADDVSSFMSSRSLAAKLLVRSSHRRYSASSNH